MKVIMVQMNGLFCMFLVLICVHGCPPHELKALLKFRESVVDDHGNLKSWEGEECCAWRGVECNEMEMGRLVSKLDLHGFQVRDGTISWLFELKHLKYLDLGDNYISVRSQLPPGLGSLTNLTYLDMSQYIDARDSGRKCRNCMDRKLEEVVRKCEPVSRCSSGNDVSLEWLASLPSLEYLSLNKAYQVAEDTLARVIGSLSQLKHLGLSRCGLSGSTILVSVFNLPYLDFLDMSWNEFSGSMSLFNLSSLTYLDLSRNKFSGPIPYWLQNMTKLVSLDLAANLLDGPIPNTLTELHFLTNLDLSQNNMGGTIPMSVCNLTYLTRLDLSSNILTGGIPSLWNMHTQFRSLSYLNLEDNELEGTIPPNLDFHTTLTNIHLSYNRLSGRIPPRIGNLYALVELRLRDNQLSGSLPMSFGQLNSLTYLDVSKNQLNESITSLLSLPSSLVLLDLSNNKMQQGAVSDEVLVVYISTKGNMSERSRNPTQRKYVGEVQKPDTKEICRRGQETQHKGNMSERSKNPTQRKYVGEVQKPDTKEICRRGPKTRHKGFRVLESGKHGEKTCLGTLQTRCRCKGET
ncbi:hypothetical protein KI387_035790 [Taxus chinensis]|uniref:Leucine-rich repeat-containing N-terminal plant-type domain-containing protein n=1 Tax=Taxus chinensis TaxID=29808 RepID=A0AA38KR16_TAXCH|nr:hypothetical protein KI387_035790 [Taxus chinensis]